MTEPDHAIAVYRYGLLRPRDWGADCEAEMARMTALWNRLVAIEAENTAAVRQVSDVAQVRAAQAEIDALLARRQALMDQRAAVRMAARKKVKTPELDAGIRAVGAELRPAIEAARALRKAARTANRSAMAAIEERRKAAVKLARQQSGLYWGQYNAVCGSYERARQAALKRGGTLKPSSGNANRITNQLQGGLTWQEIASGGMSQISVGDTPPGENGYLMLTATIFTGRDAEGQHTRRTVTWPLILHRPIPEDARIQEVVVTRELRAGTWRWNAVFTCRVPRRDDARTEACTRACGIDIGWRQTDDGVRVAVIASDDGIEEIRLPQALVDRLMRYYELGAQRHQARHEMLLRLTAVNWSRAPAALRSRAEAVQAKRDEKGNLSASGLDLRSLAAAWQATAFLPDLRAEMAEWAIDDRRLWLSASGRKRAMLARREFYRIAAKRIVDAYGVIGIEAVNWSDAASGAGEKLPAAARRMRVIVSTSELMLAIRSAAKREGVRIHEHAGRSSFRCHACGHDTAVNDRGTLHYTCGHCFAVHDQDENAARNLLAAARASAPVVPETPLPLAWQKRLEGKQKRRLESSLPASEPAE